MFINSQIFYDHSSSHQWQTDNSQYGKILSDVAATGI